MSRTDLRMNAGPYFGNADGVEASGQDDPHICISAADIE
jgi:hypothetical protein